MKVHWENDDKLYYIQGKQVVKSRMKRRLETGEYVLQNQKKNKVCEMYDTREGAEQVLAAATTANGARASSVADGQKGIKRHDTREDAEKVPTAAATANGARAASVADRQKNEDG